MPTAKDMPARLTTLRFLPSALMTRKLPRMLMGMAVATTIVALTLRRKIKRTTMASTPPMMMFFCTRPMAPFMYGLWS